VHASSINAFDVAVAAGTLQGMMEYQFPTTIGSDLAGVVEQVGSEVSRYQVREKVFGFLGMAVLHEGTWADYVASPEDEFVVPKPTNLDFLEVGTLPVAGVAALMSAGFSAGPPQPRQPRAPMPEAAGCPSGCSGLHSVAMRRWPVRCLEASEGR
jgi:NADPH:quinone reductase-like Zn-dependent oxidoreductase